MPDDEGRTRNRCQPTGPRRLSHRIPPGLVALIFAAVVLVLPEASARAATLSVNCATGGDLQAKLDAAASGSTILVKGTCLGRFFITGKAITLQGNPTATLDGNDLGGVLSINAPGRAIHLNAITITGGFDPQEGAGIFSSAASLTMNKVSVTGNLVASDSLPAQGAGVFSDGNVTISNSTLTSNRALAKSAATTANGGGVFVQNGNLTVKSSVISDNRATAHPDSGSSNAFGGGIYIDGGNLTIHGSTISTNRVTADAQSGSAQASGAGGYQASGSTVSVAGSAVIANTASADAPSGAAAVGGGGLDGITLHVTGSAVSGNAGIADAAMQATAFGGGVHAGTLTLVRSTVNANRLTASSSGGFGLGDGGGISAGGTTATASTISRNVVAANSGPGSSAGQGGGFFGSGTDTFINSTIASNKVVATSPSPGGSAFSNGGGLYFAGVGSLVNSTVAANTTSGSGATVSRKGGGLDGSSSVSLEATIIANNTATTGPDCAGGPTSNGHNLIRHAAGCSFTKAGTDKVGVDPKLGLLQANGGPTQTMAIALTSPALNAIPTPCLAKDQRGVHRPQGLKCDIGAYERKLT